MKDPRIDAIKEILGKAREFSHEPLTKKLKSKMVVVEAEPEPEEEKEPVEPLEGVSSEEAKPKDEIDEEALKDILSKILG